MIDPKSVHDTLRCHQLVDGMELVVDLERSEGSWVHDSLTNERYLDAFTCFASWPLGYNHPKMKDQAFLEELTRTALHKVSNADLYTAEMAGFVAAFGQIVTGPNFPYHFWVSGGALAVENAMKTAFDWKRARLGRVEYHEDVNDLMILHFNQAFHGRTGYTMSVTNTRPEKVGLFPKFRWPRVHNPACRFDLDGNVCNDIEAEEARACNEIETFLRACPAGGRKVAAILIEPMQGEGGDNHFRSEFLTKLRQYADEADALLIFDEVQTGFYGSGHAWMWQQKGVEPDVVAFGKKTQVCGIYAGRRIDNVEDHVFAQSSRINSTWGGNLVDMVRCRRFIEIISEEDIATHVTARGEQVIAGLRVIARETGAFDNVRGTGSLIAFSFANADVRGRMLKALYDQKVLALACGVDSIRFRLPLNIKADEVETLLERTAAATPALQSA